MKFENDEERKLWKDSILASLGYRLSPIDALVTTADGVVEAFRERGGAAETTEALSDEHRKEAIESGLRELRARAEREEACRDKARAEAHNAGWRS